MHGLSVKGEAEREELVRVVLQRYGTGRYW